MRNKIVTFADKKINVQERKIGEIKLLIEEVFPSSKGKAKGIKLDELELGWGLLYDNIPLAFPEITQTDIDNAYPSQLEELVGAFVDVNFLAIKKLLPTLMNLIQIGSQPKR